MIRILITAAIIIFSLMFACNTPPETETPPSSVQLTTKPSDLNASPEEAYPSPSSFEEYIIVDIPTPSKNLATITGVLKQHGPDTPKPVSGLLLGLADIIPGETGEPIIASFNQGSSPKTLTDDNGRFVFVDVSPVQYALILDKISDSFLLNDPNTGGDFLFTVEANQILDLGELVYDTLPEASE